MVRPGPLPHGYIEVQRVVPVEGTPGRAVEIDRALKDAALEADRNAGRRMEVYGSRLETVGDHTLLYVGFVPLREEGEFVPPPLDPRNLNEAPQRQLGQYARDPDVGFKEQRFGAGTPVALPVEHPSIVQPGAVEIKSS